MRLQGWPYEQTRAAVVMGGNLRAATTRVALPAWPGRFRVQRILALVARSGVPFIYLFIETSASRGTTL
jgi:hypothetical protein